VERKKIAQLEELMLKLSKYNESVVKIHDSKVTDVCIVLKFKTDAEIDAAIAQLDRIA